MLPKAAREAAALALAEAEELEGQRAAAAAAEQKRLEAEAAEARAAQEAKERAYMCAVDQDAADDGSEFFLLRRAFAALDQARDCELPWLALRELLQGLGIDLSQPQVIIPFLLRR